MRLAFICISRITSPTDSSSSSSSSSGGGGGGKSRQWSRMVWYGILELFFLTVSAHFYPKDKTKQLILLARLHGKQNRPNICSKSFISRIGLWCRFTT